MKNRLTMKETCFYLLYKKFKEGKGEYIPVFSFMGETFSEEVSKWGFVSYECSARLSELYSENPGLIQRQMLTGKSGAHYYGYRITPTPTLDLIKDEALRAFHKRISK